LDGDESEQITEILDLDSEASEEEESQIEEDNEDNMDWMEEEFPKRLTCIDHELNTMCHRVLDKTTSPISKLKCRVLPLINRFSKSGVAVEKLKYLAVKKLLKVVPTRWNSFFYVCNRLSKLKEAVIKVCLERGWEIDFLWNDVELCRDFLRPMAIATTFLKGHKYSTSPSVVPFLLTISEHLQDSEKKFGRFKNVCENLLGELKSRFSLIMDPYSRNFDSTFLICTMLSPLKTTKLDDELFSTGKQRLKMHLLSPSASITSIRETLSSSTSTVHRTSTSTSTEGKTSVSDGLHTSNKKEEQKIAAQQD
ncbi:Uncharacterized protein APZ42_008390, partial [Daphnia magna]